MEIEQRSVTHAHTDKCPHIHIQTYMCTGVPLSFVLLHMHTLFTRKDMSTHKIYKMKENITIEDILHGYARAMKEKCI